MSEQTFTIPSRPLTWFVTGASSGFGLSLVRAAQAQKQIVIATSRNPSRTPDLVAEVEANGGKWVSLDLNDKNCASVIDDLEKAGTKIDVLVNNGGYSIFAPFETFTDDENRMLMETIYFGPARLIRAVLPHMRARRFGVVVNMSSGAALQGRESMSVYAGAKAALDGATRVFTKEVAPFNIRTLTVVPGTFVTGFGGAAVLGEKALPEDYKGSVAGQTMEYIRDGKVPSDGDADKAMKALLEVVLGVGVGKGREAERFLPLGRDITPRLKLTRDNMQHAIDVFGSVTDNVYLEK